MHRYTEAFARPRPRRRAGAAHRRGRDPARALPQRPAHPLPPARARRAARSSTRTTPWPPTRSASATTTGWPRWSRTWSTPTCSCCSPTSTASTTATRPSRGRGWCREVRGEADLAGVPLGPARSRPGVGTGGMVTKVEAARIATGAGHPGRPHVRRAGRRGAAPATTVGTLLPPRPVARAAPGCSGWRTRPRRGVGCDLDAGAVAAVVERRLVAAPGGRHRRRRATSSPATRSTWSTRPGTVVARGLVNYDAAELPRPARPVHPRPGARARPRRTSARSSTATTSSCSDPLLRVDQGEDVVRRRSTCTSSPRSTRVVRIGGCPGRMTSAQRCWPRPRAPRTSRRCWPPPTRAAKDAALRGDGRRARRAAPTRSLRGERRRRGASPCRRHRRRRCVDRLTLTRDAARARSPTALREVAGAARPGRRGGARLDAAQRPASCARSGCRSASSASSTRPGRTSPSTPPGCASSPATPSLLRGSSSAQRHQRRARRRLRDALGGARPAARRGPARRRGTSHESVKHLMTRPRPGRRADPARRRRPDPVGGRGVDGAGDRDRRRQLPRLRRRRRRPRHGRGDPAQREDPAAVRSATRPRRCWCTRTSPTSSCPRALPALAATPASPCTATRAVAGSADESTVAFAGAPTRTGPPSTYSLDIAAGVVDSLDDALAHIRRWSSGHTEAIVTDSQTCGAAVRRRGRRGGGHGQRLDPVHRRRRVRLRRRDRHLHPEAARPRPDGAAGADRPRSTS